MTDVDALAKFGILLARPGMLIIVSPFYGAGYAPAQVRAGLTLLIGVALAPLVNVPDVAAAAPLAIMLLREAAIGLAFGLCSRLIVAAGEFAGSLVSMQSGLSYAAMMDPQSGVRNTTMSVLYANLIIILALATNAHHTWLRAITASYDALPIGIGGIGANLGAAVAQLLGLVFVIGLRLAAPVIVVMLLAEIVLGLMVRVAPSLNLMVIGAPIRTPIGLLVAAAALVGFPAVISRVFPATLDAAVSLARALR